MTIFPNDFYASSHTTINKLYLKITCHLLSTTILFLISQDYIYGPIINYENVFQLNIILEGQHRLYIIYYVGLSYFSPSFNIRAFFSLTLNQTNNLLFPFFVLCLQ